MKTNTSNTTLVTRNTVGAEKGSPPLVWGTPLGMGSPPWTKKGTVGKNLGAGEGGGREVVDTTPFPFRGLKIRFSASPAHNTHKQQQRPTTTTAPPPKQQKTKQKKTHKRKRKQQHKRQGQQPNSTPKKDKNNNKQHHTTSAGLLR
jgi:hypothetical protein